MIEFKQFQAINITEVQQHLLRSYLQDLHAPSIEWPRRTINDHERSYMTKHDLYHWLATYCPTPSTSIALFQRDAGNAVLRLWLVLYQWLCFFLHPVKQVSLAGIRNTLIFCGDWETGINCKVYPTFSGKLVAPSQSWKGGHQYQLNIKQEDVKVYDRIQTNSSNQYHWSPATLVSLLSPRFACSKYRMTTKDHQRPWTIIHDQTWSISLTSHLLSHTIN